MRDSHTLSRMIEEYGNMQRKEEKAEATVVERIDESAALGGHKESDEDRPALMQEEERLTGAVSWKTYGVYFRYAGGLSWAPLILLLTGLMQGAQGTRERLSTAKRGVYSLRALVANNLFLGFWTSESVKGFTQADYMGTYVSLGVGTAIFSFGLSYSLT